MFFSSICEEINIFSALLLMRFFVAYVLDASKKISVSESGTLFYSITLSVALFLCSLVVSAQVVSILNSRPVGSREILVIFWIWFSLLLNSYESSFVLVQLRCFNLFLPKNKMLKTLGFNTCPWVFVCGAFVNAP